MLSTTYTKLAHEGMPFFWSIWKFSQEMYVCKGYEELPTTLGIVENSSKVTEAYLGVKGSNQHVLLRFERQLANVNDGDSGRA